MKFRITSEKTPTHHLFTDVVFTCPVCDGSTIVTFENYDEIVSYHNWAVGELHIQDAFPEISPAYREVFLTGMHDECFDNYLGEEE